MLICTLVPDLVHAEHYNRCNDERTTRNASSGLALHLSNSLPEDFISSQLEQRLECFRWWTCYLTVFMSVYRDWCIKGHGMYYPV